LTRDDQQAPPDPGPRSAQERLDSWKEIAAYLKRDVRTVRRWEKTRDLPVHRHPYLKRGLVYGYKEELDSWWNDGHEPDLKVRPASQGVGEGLRQEVPPPQGWRRWRARTTALVAGFAVVLLALFLGVDRGGVADRPAGALEPSPIGSIAVLPLENLSSDPEQEYFSDGMTDVLISELGKVGALRVISRQSAMRFKGSELSVSDIARALKVEAVVEGSAQLSNDRVRVTVHLLRAEPEQLLGAETFERHLEDVLVLQGEMAQAIAAELEVVLIPEETRRLADAPKVDPEAYDAYLKGSYHWQKLNARDADTAERYFEMALQEDPSFAPAWAGLALVWLVREKAGAASAPEAALNARAAALRALELDDRCAEAHLVLAGVKTWYDWDWDWAGAHSEWRRALELDPRNATVHAYYAHFLANVGRIDEAVFHIERALEMDPLNDLLHGLYAGVLNYQCRYDDALAAARTALFLQPDAWNPKEQRALALMALGRRDELLALQQEDVADDPELATALESGLAEAGFEGAQRNMAEVLAARCALGDRVRALDVAWHYFLGADHDQAVSWLEQAYEDHESNLPYVTRPFWDPLRSDPRFLGLLRRMNLPPAEPLD
jgi:TolB-like protein/Tfp pilus assembly protein PilF